MGCCCSEEEDPLMARYRAAKDYLSKANIILALAGKEEKRGRIVKAVNLYGTYLRCMAVHCFKEFDRKKKDELLNVAQSCRRICMHRISLEPRARRESEDGCCSGPLYVPGDPPGPVMLQPYEWKEWMAMCRGSGDIEAALKRMGLIKHETKEKMAMRIAEASKSTTTVSLALNNQVNPNINVAPTITGPTTSTNISGPSTNITGPNTSTTVNPNLANAQTGEGNVAPATGAHAGGNAGQPAIAPAMAPGMAPMMMMPTPSGWMPMMMPMGSSGSSGDYAAAAAAMQQQQQQQMMMQQQMMAAGGGQAMYMQGMPQGMPASPMGGTGSPMGGMMPQQQAFSGAYMMSPNGSGGYMQNMPMAPMPQQGGPMGGVMQGYPAPMPQQPGMPPPPEGYPPPAAGVPPKVV